MLCECALHTCVHELLPDCRSSCLPVAPWRSHYGTWFPPWGPLPAPAANSPAQSSLCMTNNWQMRDASEGNVITLRAFLPLSDRCCCWPSVEAQLVESECSGRDRQEAGNGSDAASPYLQRQPVAVGSPCNSPSRPAGSPPRWPSHPAAAADVSRGVDGDGTRWGMMGERQVEREGGKISFMYCIWKSFWKRNKKKPKKTN